MKQTGILFQTEMVKAIDQNLKTQTRRTSGLKKINENPNHWEFVKFDGDKAQFWNKHRGNGVEYAKSPYGMKGDVLWVRETWYNESDFGDKPAYIYKASNPDWLMTSGGNWKPSIHMPKDAARIWLQIEEISLERIQDISEQDAIAEGMKQYDDDPKHDWLNARFGFKMLWEDINGWCSWENNPWVWVIKFKRIEKP